MSLDAHATPEPFHFPRPAVEFALIKAELDLAVMRAFKLHPELVAPGKNLNLAAAISSQLLASRLNPEFREARD